MRLLALLCAFAFAASGAEAANGRWIGSWAASPAMPMAAPANNPARGTPTFNNQTITQVVRLSAGGSRLRIRLSNEYGPKPLRIGAVRVALVGRDGVVVPGSAHAVTFSGEAAATIPAGSPLLSDPVALPTKALASLRVALYLPADSNGCTCHMTGMDLVSIAPGDATQAPPAPAKDAPDYRAFLTQVDVETAAPLRPVIATFGDSITDGYRSTDNGNHRWPDRLAERLDAGKRPFAVVNPAISGNRVLTEQLPIFGQNALARFDRDVLAIPGVTHVTVLEGVNDLGMTKPTPAAAEIIAGYRQLIARTHEHGMKIIGGTILPYGGAVYFSAAGEAERQKINAWIRTGHEFDGVIDFDAAMRDPAKPERMRAELQSGDWLHPNDSGYRVMGEAVDLSLFQ
ncbi:SGNH/GDSL hydrolase family protein [Phenylobacterium sp.]|uniref:SGNH/GDSL hydrolase family protein n=1 Tax=Phenylobacterium sp. TaxID=1871053 RepID=UPI00120C5B33|nr:SGNH/GDSL hydrolase family protein [Phenylobacterium sp.]THD58074.1 MAG: SGNH/GDSL hydrolase family protein [Phenylobacterium sp.]